MSVSRQAKHDGLSFFPQVKAEEPVMVEAGVAEPEPEAEQAPAQQAPAAPYHAPISVQDNFLNRYVGGTNDIRLNEHGGTDIGMGGSDDPRWQQVEVHIHTAMFIECS